MLLSEIENKYEDLSYAALDHAVATFCVGSCGIFSKSHIYTNNSTDDEEYFNLWKYFSSNSDKCLVEFGNPPPGLLYADSNTIIFERPPTMKMVSWCDSLLEDINEATQYYTFEIPVPWQVYFVHFTPSEDGANIVSHIFMAFSNTQVHSEDQILYQPPLANFYTNGKLCAPHYETYAEISDGTETISGIMQNAYNQVWDSESNNDLTQSFIAFQRHFSTPSCYPTTFGDRINFVISEKNIHLLENTVAKHMDFSLLPSSIGECNTILNDTYYTVSSYAHHFYKSWSKIPLSEICNLEWAPLDLEENDGRLYLEVLARVFNREFFQYIKDATGYEISYENKCCEDCLGYDEDYDNHYCLEEDCSCHSPLLKLNKNFWINPETGNTFFYEYFNEAGMLPKPFTTVLDVYNNFVRKSNNAYMQKPFLVETVLSSELSRLASLNRSPSF